MVALVLVAAAGLTSTATVAVVALTLLHRRAEHTEWALAAEVHALRREHRG